MPLFASFQQHSAGFIRFISFGLFHSVHFIRSSQSDFFHFILAAKAQKTACEGAAFDGQFVQSFFHVSIFDNNRHAALWRGLTEAALENWDSARKAFALADPVDRPPRRAIGALPLRSEPPRGALAVG